MLNSKLYLFCNRALISSVCRSVQMDSVLFKQFKKPNQVLEEEPSFIDPGIRHRASVFKDDPELLEQLATGDADIEDLESDFRRASEIYDEHFAEMKRDKERIARIVARKKFFKPPKEPSMLTYNEKQHIKHLHAENPHEWNVTKLSESFPATEFIIKKILKANWRPLSVERIKLMDEQVARNWELLAENKLEASPDIIEHCKKFVDRRETLLAQLKNKEFHKLPPIERKVKWQCGAMTKILLQYERQIDQLYQKQLQGQSEVLPGTDNRQKSIDPSRFIEQRIEYEKFLQDVKDKDTLVIGGEYVSGEEVTLDFLENQLHQTVRNNETLPLFDKIMLDKSSNNKLTSTNSLVQSKQLSSEPEEKDLTSQEKDIESHRPFPINEYLKKPKKKEKKSSKNLKSQSVIGEADLKKLKRSQKPEAKTYNPFQEEERENFYDISDEELGHKAIRLEEENLSESIEFVEGNKPRLKAKVNEDDSKNFTTKVVNKSELKPIDEGENLSKPKIELSYKSNEHLEKLRVEQEVNDIADTCFWNDKSKKNKQSKPAVKQAALAELSKPGMSFEDDNYPGKIEIPQKYVGSGKIFKIKDCYYDDKGDFLYRVPGMTK